MKLRKHDDKIIAYLERRWPLWVPPTQIGREVGGGGRHSGWASPKCLRLVKRGDLERNEEGHYRRNKNLI